MSKPGGSHAHHAEHRYEGRKNLLITVLLNALITASEIAGGLLSGSLSLLSDALHNLSDTVSIFIAWLAQGASRKPSSTKKTFGFKRVEILAALFNAAVLIGVCVYLLLEAWNRLKHPQEIQGAIMVWVAVFGLAGNLVGMILLRSGSAHSLNIRAAYLHLLGDTLSSVAVIIGGVLIWIFRLHWIDPVLSILISIYILKETYGVLKQAVDILMQAVPAGLDLGEVEKCLLANAEIANVHHVHAWNLTDEELHFECHLDLMADVRLSEADQLRLRIEADLKRLFAISHTTLQFEYDCCGDKRLIRH